MRVLSFDVGIKNLAWCLIESRTVDAVYDPSSYCWGILDWGVWDLRMDIEDELYHPECCREKTSSGKDCKKEPIYVDISNGISLGGLCKTHYGHCNSPYTSENIREVSKMTMSALHKKASEMSIASKGKMKKEIISDICSVITQRYLCKIPPLKKAKSITLADIHDRIIQRLRDIHYTSDIVLIENQPVRMNAAMKSVQMILWTTLRDRMLQQGVLVPDVRFINANKKLMVVPDDSKWGVTIVDHKIAVSMAKDRKYAERKSESIMRVEKILCNQSEHLEWFKGHSKRDDLADCLLMCLFGAIEKST